MLRNRFCLRNAVCPFACTSARPFARLSFKKWFSVKKFKKWFSVKKFKKSFKWLFVKKLRNYFLISYVLERQ